MWPFHSPKMPTFEAPLSHRRLLPEIHPYQHSFNTQACLHGLQKSSKFSCSNCTNFKAPPTTEEENSGLSFGKDSWRWAYSRKSPKEESKGVMERSFFACFSIVSEKATYIKRGVSAFYECSSCGRIACWSKIKSLLSPLHTTSLPQLFGAFQWSFFF